MLPELTDRLATTARRAFAGFGSKTLTLDLKSDPGFGGADWYLRNGFYGLAAMRGATTGPAWSGESVTLNTALNHSVVWACNRLVSGSIGFVSANLMQDMSMAATPTPGKRAAVEHPMYTGMRNAPNCDNTAQEFTEQLTSHTLLGGNGFAQIARRSGPKKTAMELYPLLPDQVTPDRESTGQKRLTYVVKDGNAAEKTYTVEPGKPHDILHIRGIGWDGLRGYSVIAMGRQSIGSAIAAERHVGRFWARGGRTPYNLKLTQDWDDNEAGKKFRDDWNAIYSNPNEAPILPPWLTYEKTGLTMVESQVLESRLFSIHEICRWFGVSPHLVGDLSRATFSNIEQLALEFEKLTLAEWMTRWEQAFWRCVLTPEEQSQGYFLLHDTSALRRGDFASRMAGYATALQNGELSIDEVRDMEGRNPLPNGAGSHHHIQLNMQSLPGGDQSVTAQSAQLVRLGGQ